MDIQLGDLVEDAVTRFRGRVVGRAQYLTGCNQAYVVPQADSPHKYPDGMWLDEGRLCIVGHQRLTLPAASENPGGPQHNLPPRY